MDLTKTVDVFKTYLEKYMALNYAGSLFHWDAATGAPKGGVESRARIMGLLQAEAFVMAISDKMKDFLDALGPELDSLDEITRATYRKCKRDYDSMAKIPPEEFREYAETCALAENCWEDAKERSDYKSFAPWLKKIVEFNKKFIGYRGYTGHPYNTLLDDYEPGMTVEKLDAFFEQIKASVVPLIKKITQSGVTIDDAFLGVPVPKAKQERISALLMDALGYDTNRGMLRESEHPFTTGFGKNDVRMTTHYHESAFLSSLYSVMHEAGHAIYDQNSADAIANTVLDGGVSMGVHESQSRFYENIIGRSRGFWKRFRPELVGILGGEFKNISAEKFYLAANIAKPSLIRIEADELTYPLHIMVRYEIEKAVLSEKDFDADSLPEIWADKYEEYLGVRPRNDAEGILQDVHWSSGLFGYFPSYAVGSALASQFLFFMNKDINAERLVEAGDIGAINGWLKEKIHQHGSVKMPEDLIMEVCGEPLDSKYYTDYLEKKFGAIYGV